MILHAMDCFLAEAYSRKIWQIGKCAHFVWFWNNFLNIVTVEVGNKVYRLEATHDNKPVVCVLYTNKVFDFAKIWLFLKSNC